LFEGSEFFSARVVDKGVRGFRRSGTSVRACTNEGVQSSTAGGHPTRGNLAYPGLQRLETWGTLDAWSAVGHPPGFLFTVINGEIADVKTAFLRLAVPDTLPALPPN